MKWWRGTWSLPALRTKAKHWPGAHTVSTLFHFIVTHVDGRGLGSSPPKGWGSRGREQSQDFRWGVKPRPCTFPSPAGSGFWGSGCAGQLERGLSQYGSHLPTPRSWQLPCGLARGSVTTHPHPHLREDSLGGGGREHHLHPWPPPPITPQSPIPKEGLSAPLRFPFGPSLPSLPQRIYGFNNADFLHQSPLLFSPL